MARRRPSHGERARTSSRELVSWVRHPSFARRRKVRRGEPRRVRRLPAFAAPSGQVRQRGLALVHGLESVRVLYHEVGPPFGFPEHGGEVLAENTETQQLHASHK